MKFEIEKGIAPEPEANEVDVFEALSAGDSIWFMTGDEAGDLARSFTTWTQLNGKPLYATARPVNSTDPKGAGWRVFVMALNKGEMRPIARLDFIAIWMTKCIHAGGKMYRTSAAFEMFKRWMGEVDPGSITKFTQVLRERGVTLKRRSDGWYLTGIEIVDGERLPQVEQYNRDIERFGRNALIMNDDDGDDDSEK